MTHRETHATHATDETDETDEVAIAAERALHDPQVRTDPSQVEMLLHPSFREIGRSGRIWTRESTIAALRDEPTDGPRRGALMSEIHVERPADDLVLLTYAFDVAGSTTRRSSLWRVTGRRAELLFHQGTPVP